MFRRSTDFVRDQKGSGPVYVIWVIVLMVFAGIGIDTVNAYRMRTAMQAAADAAALAAVLDLPASEAEARQKAIDYANAIIPPEADSVMISAEDIQFGKWDDSSGKVILAQDPSDSVVVNLELSNARGNQVSATLLRLLPGFTGFDISVGAVAIVRWRQCRTDGLISNSSVQMFSGNTFGDRLCVYGKDGIVIANGNDFTGETVGALIGVGETAWFETPCNGLTLTGNQGSAPECDMSSNPGLAENRFISDSVWPDRINATLLERLDQYRDVLDGFSMAGSAANGEVHHFAMAEWSGRGGDRNKPTDVVNDILTSSNGMMKTVFMECETDDDDLILRHGSYADLTLVTNCLLDISGGAQGNPNSFRNVEFVGLSRASLPRDRDFDMDRNIIIRGHNIMGAGCTGLDEMRITSTSGVHVEGDNTYDGASLTTLGGVIIKGTNQGSLSVHANGDIGITSTSDFQVCEGQSDYFRVKPRTRLAY